MLVLGGMLVLTPSTLGTRAPPSSLWDPRTKEPPQAYDLFYTSETK